YFTLYQANNLLNGFVDVQGGLLGAIFLDQGANPPDHIAGALPVPDNALYCLPRFLQVWSPACEPPQTGVGVGYDGREWLIDLVSNGGRYLSHGRDPRHMSQLRLRLTQGRFGLLALGDVTVDRILRGPASFCL